MENYPTIRESQGRSQYRIRRKAYEICGFRGLWIDRINRWKVNPGEAAFNWFSEKFIIELKFCDCCYKRQIHWSMFYSLIVPIKDVPGYALFSMRDSASCRPWSMLPLPNGFRLPTPPNLHSALPGGGIHSKWTLWSLLTW